MAPSFSPSTSDPSMLNFKAPVFGGIYESGEFPFRPSCLLDLLFHRLKFLSMAHAPSTIELGSRVCCWKTAPLRASQIFHITAAISSAEDSRVVKVILGVLVIMKGIKHNGLYELQGAVI
ncbi:uncharacterized protein LOC130138564 [Syzygium oleosum]|uniref:uncharacterized protein LOC130138564 n=1 Tax=Syzygium oleosum TaxID=219896 RepID=UPI0024BA70E7|nr:uncharacterized protein LOC130138564 [Syzygium oleosum]